VQRITSTVNLLVSLPPLSLATTPNTMFSGAQISLYPMCDDFVQVILSSLSALDPYRPQLRIETDDISTLLVGPPEVLFNAMRDLFVAASKSGKHVTMHATISRGCPGEPDAEICQPRVKIGGDRQSGSEAEVQKALQAVESATLTGQEVSAVAHMPLAIRPRS
jgi:hypothetical protein